MACWGKVEYIERDRERERERVLHREFNAKASGDVHGQKANKDDHAVKVYWIHIDGLRCDQ